MSLAIRFLRQPEVQQVTGLPRSSMYALITTGKFPRPIPIGRKARAWRSDQIQAWIEAQIRGASNAEASKTESTVAARTANEHEAAG